MEVIRNKVEELLPKNEVAMVIQIFINKIVGRSSTDPYPLLKEQKN